MIEIPLIDRSISATIYQMHTLLEKKEILFGGAVIAGKKLKKKRNRGRSSHTRLQSKTTTPLAKKITKWSE